jgi:SET domain-containing protein
LARECEGAAFINLRGEGANTEFVTKELNEADRIETRIAVRAIRDILVGEEVTVGDVDLP